MITVYTVIFGDATRDQLRPPPPGCDARYVCFTDCAHRVATGGSFDRSTSADDRRSSWRGLYKTRPDRWFGTEAVTIWTDASCQLLQPAEALWAAAEAPVMGFLHPDRPCVQAEAHASDERGLAPGAGSQAPDGGLRGGRVRCRHGDGHHDGRADARSDGAPIQPRLGRSDHPFNVRDQLSIDYCGWATRPHWSVARAL
jgi:hypothetical protein